MSQPGFWDDQEKAQELVGELKSLKSLVKPLGEALSASDDLETMLEMAEDEPSLEGEIAQEVQTLEAKLEQLELSTLLNGPHDHAGALLTIHARDGGTDANDWAEMLLRMYTQWAQKHGYTVELIDRSD